MRSLNSIIKNESIDFVSLKYVDDKGLFKSFDSSFENLDQLNDTAIKKNLLLDTDAVFWDPFRSLKTLNIISYTQNPSDYRAAMLSVSRKLPQSCELEFSFSIEFFIFERIDCNVGDLSSSYSIVMDMPTSINNNSNTLIPLDSYDLHANIRTEICRILKSIGIDSVAHNVGCYVGQHQIHFGKFRSIKEAADSFLITKYIIRQVVSSYGRVANFLSKPIRDNVSNAKLNCKIRYAGFLGNIIYNLKTYLDDCTAIFRNTTNSYLNVEDMGQIQILSNEDDSIEVIIPYLAPSINPYLALSAFVLLSTYKSNKTIDFDLPSTRALKVFNINLSSDFIEACDKLHLSKIFKIKEFIPVLENYIKYSTFDIDSVKNSITPQELLIYSNY